MKNLTTKEMLLEVITHFGSISELGKVLGISHAAISQWLSSGKIPELRCYQIEIYSQGKFKANQLLSNCPMSEATQEVAESSPAL